MDIFTQKKILVRVVIFLVLLNLFSMGSFLLKDCSRKNQSAEQFNKNKDVSAILKKELNLTEKQVVQIKNLRSGFFVKEQELVKKIKAERDSMNAVMFTNAANEELVKALAKRVADNEYKMELLRFQQAQELKAICSEEQLLKFGKLIKEIRDYFRPDNQPKKSN